MRKVYLLFVFLLFLHKNEALDCTPTLTHQTWQHDTHTTLTLWWKTGISKRGHLSNIRFS